MNIAVYCGAAIGDRPVYMEMARKLGLWIGSHGHDLVYGAGRRGLMGAVADGVLETGGKVYGVIPEFLCKMESKHDGLTETEVVKTMSVRKQLMIDKSDAFVALPGGPGTLEEIVEIISLVRLDQTKKPCIVYNLNGFYDPLKNMYQMMADRQFVQQEFLDRIIYPTDLEQVFTLLSKQSRKK